MAANRKPTSGRDRVRKHREKLRQQGLRPIQLWVPDVRSAKFRAQARRDSLAIANSDSEADDQAFVDSISIWPPRGEKYWNSHGTSASRASSDPADSVPAPAGVKRGTSQHCAAASANSNTRR